ncbi:hypothetical protein GKQ38_01570 [Candidatus Nanohaloarchaea archaeon]|nr:hypothetical protein GKQ38_01570 [Candidatus Nanohaloarchaea archaeon]
MEFDWFDQAVDYAEEEYGELEGREFEASVRKSLSALGFDTTFVQDVELDEGVVNSYRVETDEGDYRIAVHRDQSEIEIYDRPDHLA